MTASVFSVPVFFVVFRETVETVIIVSILLAFLKQMRSSMSEGNEDNGEKAYKKLRAQVWWGVGLGLAVCIISGAVVIAIFYTKGRNAWSKNDNYYSGSFALVAALLIGYLGGALLRISKIQDKWRVKLVNALELQSVTVTGKRKALKRWGKKYALFLVPFVTVMREGIEAIVFLAGVSFTAPATAVPLPVVIGLLAGSAIGYILYKGGATSKLQFFLIGSTCFLYLIGAGLFSRAIWSFQAQNWNLQVGGDAAEVGAGPGSYDIDESVWHVNYGNPNLNGGGGWGIFNAIFGWTNSATYGSVIGYNLYWLCTMIGFAAMRYKEVNGHWPLLKAPKDKDTKVHHSEHSNSPASSGIFEKTSSDKKVTQEVHAVPAKEVEV